MSGLKKGFTIVELMMVVAIIGILMGIVTSAAQGSIRTARVRKADAACKVVQQGLATYYAQKGKWPGSIGGRIASGSFSGSSNQEGVEGRSDSDKYVLETAEIKSMITDMIKEAKQGNPMMDISGLYVSSQSGERNSRDVGLDFKDAIMGTKKHPKKMSVAQMNFGYPEERHGYFRHFKVIYSIPTDEMTVTKQDADSK